MKRMNLGLKSLTFGVLAIVALMLVPSTSQACWLFGGCGKGGHGGGGCGFGLFSRGHCAPACNAGACHSGSCGVRSGYAAPAVGCPGGVCPAIPPGKVQRIETLPPPLASTVGSPVVTYWIETRGPDGRVYLQQIPPPTPSSVTTGGSGGVASSPEILPAPMPATIPTGGERQTRR
jgi:hypothetical protein